MVVALPMQIVHLVKPVLMVYVAEAMAEAVVLLLPIAQVAKLVLTAYVVVAEVAVQQIPIAQVVKFV